MIIIAGGGKVGAVLARDLVEAGHEVVVLERDRQKAQVLEDQLGSSVLPCDASEGRWLDAAGVRRAEMLIAVTGDDEDNMIICQLGQALSGNRARAIARVNNPKNGDTFRLLGIEALVDATDLVMSTIEEDVRVSPAIHLVRLRSAGVDLVEFPVMADSPAAGQLLRALPLPKDGCRIAAILRGRDAVFPASDTVLEAGDAVVAVVERPREEELRRLFAPTAVQPSG